MKLNLENIFKETPPGSWMDKYGCCKVCGGEIPYGHIDECDIYKMEQEIKRLQDRLLCYTSGLSLAKSKPNP